MSPDAVRALQSSMDDLATADVPQGLDLAALIRPEAPQDPVQTLAATTVDHAAMVVNGRIERSAALAVERSSRDVTHLDRLVWHFDRRNYGALRRLIDDINSWSVALD